MKKGDIVYSRSLNKAVRILSFCRSNPIERKWKVLFCFDLASGGVPAGKYYADGTAEVYRELNDLTTDWPAGFAKPQ